MAKGEEQAAPTQTSQYIMSPEQRELMALAMPGVREFAASTPQRYQGQTIAGFTPENVQGQNMVLNAANTIGGVTQNAANTSNFYTSGNIWDPSVNSNLRNAVDASVRPITEALTEKALPAIGSEATQTGNFGSSRHGIAQAQAIRDATRNIGDTASKVVQNQYDTNVNAQLKALGMVPQTQQAQTAAGTITSGVGDVRRGLEQAYLDEARGNFNFDQYAPFMRSKEVLSLMQGLPGGQNVTTGSVPPQPGKAQQALGGAAQGAALGSAIMPGIGTAVGALGGAVLPFVF